MIVLYFKVILKQIVFVQNVTQTPCQRSKSTPKKMTNFRIPAQTALRQGQKYGTMHKLGEKVKNWKNRLFILMKSNLLYYKSPDDKHFTGAINILNCPIMRCDPSETPGMKHSLKIQTKTRTYYLAAASEQDANEWVSD